MPIALRDCLEGIASNSLQQVLDDGPGWQIESDGKPLAWTDIRTSERDPACLTWSVAHASGLRADVTLQRDEAVSAARLQVTLSNPTDHDSTPLSAIKPFCLDLINLPREAVGVRSIGGGLTQAFYPPGAYRERTLTFRQGGSERYRIESGPDGRSSNRDLPFLQVTIDEGIDAGLVIALEWSGQWYQQIGPAGRATPFSWEAGIPVHGLILAPGEALALPTAHIIAFQGDQDQGSVACRRYVSDRVSPLLNGERPLPPISYDSWFGIGCDFDESYLRRLADRAAELGLEYFVIDAGWFGGCGSGYAFSQGVGNWERIDHTKFPNGIEPFASYVRERGLKLGLWFEVERAHRSSDLVREHPDWFLDVGAEYLHLNLALREAQDYVIRVVGGWIDRLGLEWSRWDYNIGPKSYWEKADPTGKIQFAHLVGLYRVLDRLIADHPKWLVECCASGGRRIDLGTLRRAHSIWFSDHTEDALVCRIMQTGANRFLPGNFPNSSVPVARNAGDGTTSDGDIISRMCGALSFDGDIASWSPQLTARAAQLVNIYREFRHLLVADFYPLTPHPARPDEGEVVQFVSRDGSDAVILGFSGAAPLSNVNVRPKALDPAATYDVWDPVERWTKQVSGKTLASEGLTLSLEKGASIQRLRRVAGR